MKRTLGVCFAWTLMVAVASAQQPGGAPGGRGGRGGFGGGGFGGVTQLVQTEKVQEELKIKTGQKRRITELAEEMRTEMQGMFNFQEFQGLGEEQRQQKMEELRVKGQEMQAKATAKLKEILDSDQMDRLNQLKLQQTGIRALAEEDVAEQLGLSPAQKAKVTKITTEAQQAMMQGFTRGGAGGFGGAGGQQMSDEERKKMFADMQKRGEEMRKKMEDMNTELTNVLTEAQKAQFEEMKGEKFEFPAFGGFGGPGGRGSPGGGATGGPGGTPAPKAEEPAAPPAEEPAAEKPTKKGSKKPSTKSSKTTKKPK